MKKKGNMIALPRGTGYLSTFTGTCCHFPWLEGFMSRLTLSRLLGPEFLPALPWTITMTAQHVLVPLRGVLETVVAEIAPVRGRTSAGKFNTRMCGIKHETYWVLR